MLLIDHRGRTPKKLGGGFSPAGIQVISAKNIRDGRLLVDNNVRYVTPEMYDRWMSEKLKFGDVLLTSEGPLGEAAYLQHEANYCLGQRLFALRASPEKLDGRFLYYSLRSVPMQQRLYARGTGTTAQGIRQSELVKVELDLPPLPEQHAIAAILGALDDKIELNRRMNETLEAMARALFKSWFVGFEPFRDQGMQDSHVGAIPKGWSAGKLKEIACFVKGVSYRSEDLRESDVALVTLKSVARGGGYQHEGLKPYTGEYKAEQRLQPGEVVVAHTDLTQKAEVLGRAARVQAHPDFHTLVASLDLAIVRPIGHTASAEFLYCLLSRNEFQEHAYGYANGTTVLHLSPKALPEYQCVLPPPAVVQAFTRSVRPAYQRIDHNEAESQTLAPIRDTLLPKLLSGEIQVKDAEKFVEAQI